MCLSTWHQSMKVFPFCLKYLSGSSVGRALTHIQAPCRVPGFEPDLWSLAVCHHPPTPPHDLFYSFIRVFLASDFIAHKQKWWLQGSVVTASCGIGIARFKRFDGSLECSRQLLLSLLRSVCALCLCGSALTKCRTKFSSRFDSPAAAGWVWGPGRPVGLSIEWEQRTAL